jgi:putative transposase
VLEATGIHQLLAWDITLLPDSVKGQFYYLYMVMDVWSRRILGVEVHERECSDLASAFFDRICRDEGISKETAAILHSDNGAPMRSFTLAAKMAELGVSLSFSRPRVSNDNAYAESWFRTMKYHQSYPLRRFRDLLSVQAWVDGFVHWYNTEHRHSGIKYVTPNQRHYGQADAICAIRQQTYEEARQRHPQRWSRQTRDWSQPEIVSINHPRPQMSANTEVSLIRQKKCTIP